MKKHQNKQSRRVFFYPTFFPCLTLLLGNVFTEPGCAENSTTPGLAIARHALPSISVNTEPFQPTKTPVGAKISELNKNLQQLGNSTQALVSGTRTLYDQIIQDVSLYHKTIGEIEASLQLGTTPSNPRVVALRNQAYQYLLKIAENTSRMNGAASELSKTSQHLHALTSHITSAFKMPGAIEEDHAHLLLLSGNVSQMEGTVNRLTQIIHANTQKQNTWLKNAESQFAHLSIGVEEGGPVDPSQKRALTNAYPQLMKQQGGAQSLSPKNARANLSVERTPHASRPLATPRPDTSSDSLAPLKIAQKTSPAQKEPPLKEANSSVSQPKDSERKLAEPLRKVFLNPQPKAKPLAEDPTKERPPQTASSYADFQKGRTPLGLLEPKQNIASQKWYLFSSIKRGLRKPGTIIEIVSVGDTNKAQKVKETLVDMGINPAQLHLIHVTDDKGAKGSIYLFEGK